MISSKLFLVLSFHKYLTVLSISKIGAERNLKNASAQDEIKYSHKCPYGFSNRDSKNYKTVSKKWRITEKQVTSINECAKTCEQNQYCESFEFHFLKKACMLNAVRDVDEDLKKGSAFCTKWMCPIGYRSRAGEGFGNLGKTETGLTIQECAGRCNKTSDCRFIEFFEGTLCKKQASRNVEAECEHNIKTKRTMKRSIGSTTKPVIEYRLCEKMDAKATHKMGYSSRGLGGKEICGGVCHTKVSNKNCIFPFTYQGNEYTHCTTIDNSGLSCAIEVDANKKMVKHAPCKDHCKYCDFTVCKKDSDCPKRFYCSHATKVHSTRVFATRAPGGCIPEACRNACPKDHDCSKILCTKHGKRCVPFRV